MTIKSITPQNMPSNIKFGWFFSFIFSVVAIYSFMQSQKVICVLSIIFLLFFLVTTLVSPKMLTPLNIVWHKFGLLLGKITSPIVLGLIFFVVISPIAVVTRLFGRDQLKMKKTTVDSYWVDRSPPGPLPDSFKDQF